MWRRCGRGRLWRSIDRPLSESMSIVGGCDMVDCWVFRENYDRERPRARSFRSYYRECNSGVYSLGREITPCPMAEEADRLILAWKPVVVVAIVVEHQGVCTWGDENAYFTRVWL